MLEWMFPGKNNIETVRSTPSWESDDLTRACLLLKQDIASPTDSTDVRLSHQCNAATLESYVCLRPDVHCDKLVPATRPSKLLALVDLMDFIFEQNEEPEF